MSANPRQRTSRPEASAGTQRPAHTSLALRPDGGLRLAVVADTHSAPHPDAHTHLRALRPDAILHAGDIGALDVLDGLRTVAPVLAVRGNIDAPVPDVPEALTVDITGAEGARLFRLLVLHIAVAGPKLRADALRLASASSSQLVVCGHSHVPFLGRDRGVSVFNPGSIGPRRFQLPIVFGVLEFAAGRLTMHHVDCETGQRWSP